MMDFINALLEDWMFYSLNLIAFIVVVIITKMYANSQSMKSMYALQAEMQQLKLNQNDKLFELEDICRKKKERVRLILQDLEKQLDKKDFEMTRARRNELSNVFLLEYKEAVHKHARLADQFYELNPEKYRAFVRNHIFPFLDISRKILKAVNSIDLEGEHKLTYSYKDFDFAFDMIRKHLRFFDKQRGEMYEYLKELGLSKKDLD